MGLALEKDAEECYSVDMNDAVRHGMCVSVLASELARELGCDEEFIHKVAVAAARCGQAAGESLHIWTAAGCDEDRGDEIRQAACQAWRGDT